MDTYDAFKLHVLDYVASSKNQRVSPNEAKQTLAEEFRTSTFVVNEAIKDLVEEGDLVYAYRDPCSYIEIPCNGCDGMYRPARPMHVVTDESGNRWLCDEGVELRTLTSDLTGQCWDCGEMAFTRAS